ncbi:ABC transporter permease [Actinomadura sp. B10D3]|uniref:branched-chain amino acid ABC transporter permease n=1 Tax=Actinomadura sp. B10D3 TaxID=3153557 RepID=UPI00325D1C38
MTTHLLFLMIGLGTGAVYVALAQGVVVVYKATGIINFAQGAMAAWAAFTFDEIRKSGDLVLPVGRVHIGPGLPAALAGGIGMAVVLGLVTHLLVFRPLRSAPPLAKVVASVGLMLALQLTTVIRFSDEPRAVLPVLPKDPVTWQSLTVSGDRLFLAAIVVLLTAGLWAYFRFTRTGLATRAAAENETGASLCGFSPDVLAGTAWALASGLSGTVAILAAPSTGLTAGGYTFFIVPALAVALVGRLRSLAAVCAAGLALGCAQSEVTMLRMRSWWPEWAGPGLVDVIPFVVIIVVLFLAGRGLPARGDDRAGRLPAVRRPANRPAVVLGLTGAAALALALTGGSLRFALVTSMIAAVFMLSWVLLTGFVGQISLAQLAFAGAAGFALSRLTTDAGVPFPFSLVLASLGATGLGVLVGLPALRIRGAQLAVVTLAAAVAIEQFVFANPVISPPRGNPIADPSLPGLDLAVRRGQDLIRLPFAFMVLGLLVLVAVLVGNLLRGDTGRAFLAVRSNESAAAASGIGVASTKVLAFALSSFVAGIGGCLIGYSRGQLSTASFTVLAGLTMLAVAYLCGITSVGGAILAGLAAPLGVANHMFSRAFDVSGQAWMLLSAVGMVAAVLFNPEGMAGGLRKARR